MDSKLLAKQIAGELIDSFTSAVKSLNPFTLLQVTFIIELYYLMINSTFKIALYILDKDMNLYERITPIEIQECNNSIMNLLAEYSEFILILSICMLLCGSSLFALKHLPFFSTYKMINMYCDYGIYASIWLFLMWVSYEAYKFFGTLFILFFVAIFVCGALFVKFGDVIKYKLGLS